MEQITRTCEEEENLRHSILFRDMRPEELAYALDFFRANRRTYEKGEIVNPLGEPLPFFGLVLSGCVQVQTDDIDGNPMIMATVTPGETFGESLHYLRRVSSVYIVTMADTVILTMQAQEMYPSAVQSGRNEREAALVHRFLLLLTNRTLEMNNRIQVLSKISMREKLIALFTMYANQQGSRTIRLPFDRNGLAVYLGVNRSALSRELSRMQREGLIRFDKNVFEIL